LYNNNKKKAENVPNDHIFSAAATRSITFRSVQDGFAHAGVIGFLTLVEQLKLSRRLADEHVQPARDS
jgi:hypothetical protein